VTDLVNIERSDNRQQDAIPPFYVVFKCLITLGMKIGSTATIRDNLNAFCVFVGKATYSMEMGKRNFRIFCFAR